MASHSPSGSSDPPEGRYHGFSSSTAALRGGPNGWGGAGAAGPRCLPYVARLALCSSPWPWAGRAPASTSTSASQRTMGDPSSLLDGTRDSGCPSPEQG